MKRVILMMAMALSLTSAELVKSISAHTGAICALAAAPDGTLLASAGEDKTVKLWDAVTLKAVATLPTGGKRSCALLFDAKGEFVLGGLEDGRVVRWKAAAREVAQPLALPSLGSVGTMAMDKAGQLLAVAGGRKLYVWDMVQNRVVLDMNMTSEVSSLSFSAASGWFAVGSHDHTVRLIMPMSGEQVALFNGHRFGVWAVAADRDLARLYSVGEDRQAFAWSMQSAAPLFAFASIGSTFNLTQSGSGRLIAGGGMDGMVRMWQSVDGSSAEKFQAHDEAVRAVLFIVPKNILATASDEGQISLWAIKE